MVNKCTLIGYLGGDPEIRHLENGATVGRFSVATSDSYKDKNGEWQSQTEWHNVVVWRELAEKAEQQLTKGKLVYVEGKVTYRKYTGSDNIERTICDIVANTFRKLEKSDGQHDSRFPEQEPQRTSQTYPTVSSPSGAAATAAPPPADGDDLPF